MLLITKNFFSFKFTLFVLISLNIAFAHGAKKHENKNYHVLDFDSLSSKPNCSAHKSGLGTHKLKLSHVYGPCSPFANSVNVPSTQEILVKNEARVKWLNSRTSKSLTTMDESDANSLETALPVGDGEQYLTTIGLGTPKVDYKVIIDTGSDYTWVGCRGCMTGCASMSHLFDASQSSSYISGSENFSMPYNDNSSIKGFWVYDKLTLGNDVINKFKFGCGLNIWDPYADKNNSADGLLGLGNGDLSLVSQSTSIIGKIFGYCLPKSPKYEGYVLFGDKAKGISSSTTLKFTKLLTDPPALSGKYKRNSLYFLRILGISVGGKRLNISTVVFTSVGTAIDSGTIVTHLPGKAYQALSSVFNQFMHEYERAPKQEVLDTCFGVKSGQSIKFPSVTFHFDGGADVDLDQSGIGLTFKKENMYIWCLGFTANENEDDLTIIGNTQQREMDVLYDIEAGKIGFGKKSCGN